MTTVNLGGILVGNGQPCSVAAAFWERVDRSGGDDACWPWMRASIRGYGTLRYNGKQAKAHRVAYELVHGAIGTGPSRGTWFVCHVCDNPICCNPSHLFLGSARDNTNDAVAKRRLPHGSGNHCAVLSEERVREARTAYDSGERQASIAARLGVGPGALSKAVTGSHWRHVGERTPPRGLGHRGERNHRAKLKNEQVEEIRVLLAEGVVQRTIARRYGVSPATICLIKKGVNWAKVGAQ